MILLTWPFEGERGLIKGVANLFHLKPLLASSFAREFGQGTCLNKLRCTAGVYPKTFLISLRVLLRYTHLCILIHNGKARKVEFEVEEGF
jgi:hypothetical protein